MKLFFFFFAAAVSLGFCSSAWGYTAQDYCDAGNTYLQSGNAELAARYYQQAVQMDPQNWQAYQGLGSADYKLGKTDEALKAFDESLYLNSGNTQLKQFVDNYRTAHPSDMSLPAPITAAPATQSVPAASASGVPVASSLPKAGRVEWAVGFGGDIMNFREFQDYYSEFSTNKGLLMGADVDLGGDYTLTPNFQMGLRLEGAYKSPQEVNVTGAGFTGTDNWTEAVLGGALDAKYLISLNNHYNLIFCAEGGYYSLVGSSIAFDRSNGFEDISGTENLSASNFGGKIGVTIEWLRETKAS